MEWRKMDLILYQNFWIILSISSRSMTYWLISHQYKSIWGKFKTEYCPEPLTSETMKLIGSIETKITKDKNGKNVPKLE